MNRNLRRAIGLIFWLSLLLVVGRAAQVHHSEQPAGRASAVDYLFHREERFKAIDQKGLVRIHDPVFLQASGGSWNQVGHVESVSPADGERPAEVLISWYSDQVDVRNFQLRAFQSHGDLEEVLATMFPPEKRTKIRRRLESALEKHGEELLRSLLPLVQQTLRQSVPVIEAELARSADRHRDEIDQLVRRWNDELVDEKLIPMARREVIPIVRRHGQPVAESIGRELWDRASLWRFGWRAAYDKSPLPSRNLVQQEWDRFVEQEAIPVFDQHMEEIVDAVQKTLADVSSDAEVRQEIGSAMEVIMEDPATVDLFRRILRESIVDNDQLHQVWRDVWGSDQARSALQTAGDRLEPVVRQIGDDLFGTREQGINPDFARVLRNQILGKDRRWIVASRFEPVEPAAASTPVEIEPADRIMPYPKVYLANRPAVGDGE